MGRLDFRFASGFELGVRPDATQKRDRADYDLDKTPRQMRNPHAHPGLRPASLPAPDTDAPAPPTALSITITDT